ncbi:MAG: PEP-CTERM system TPR-repeat protein PrsT [Nitrosomonadales bacterium]|nr:PEP-CTERM system TPR-repeat protein PrsT [Nitrosomonadales bacterium]
MQSANKISISLIMASGALLLMCGLAACSKTQSTQNLISEARKYHQNGDNNSAIIQLKNALQKDPKDSEARYLLGTLYNETGDPQSAEKEIRKAMSLGMNSDKALPDLARALLAQGLFQKVLDETKDSPEAQTDPEISTFRGNAYLALAKHDEAKNAFQQALGINAGYSDALIGLAKHSLLQKDVDSATRFSEQAVSQDPRNINAWLFKGDLLRTQGKSESALAAYEQALKTEPANVSVLVAKANLEIGTKNFDAAKSDIEAAKKSAPKSLIVFYTQALLDFSQGKPAAALESLQQILRVAPDHMPSVLLAGAVQYALDSMPQAEQHLKKYLGKDPNNLYARKLLASTFLKSRQAQSAIDVLSPVLIDAQQDPQLFALAGDMYTQAGDYTKAAEYFAKASALAPKSAELHSALGLSKLALGENDRAVAEMEKAVDLDAKSPRAGIMLVLTHLRLNEYDKALAAANVIVKEQPTDPLGYNLKGAAYLGKKNIADARASFEKALSIQPTYFPAVVNLVRLDQQEKKPEVAKQRLVEFLDKDKKNIQAMTALAILAQSQGQTKEVTAWLERASNENPDALQPALLLAANYLHLGEKQKALTLAKKIQASNPDIPEAMDILAQAQIANGDNPAALETYNKLASIKPDSALAQFRIATVHMSMQNQTAASAALKKSLVLQPDYLDAQLAMALLEFNQQNYNGVLSIARRIQGKNAKAPTGYVLEGDVMMAQNKSLQAVKAYEQAFALGKSGPLMVKLHSSLNKAGKGKEAIIRMDHWLKEYPADTSTRMYLAGTLLAQKQNRAAIEQFQAVLQHDPQNAAALNNLAWAYHQEKEPIALEFAEKANQILPENPSVLDTLGWILIEQGNSARGLLLLQKANSLAPDVADIHYHLVLGLVKSGDKTKARKELEQLLASGKNFARIEEARALLKQL